MRGRDLNGRLPHENATERPSRNFHQQGNCLAWYQPCSCGAQKKQSQAKENNNPNQKSDDNNQEVAFVVKGVGGGDVSEFV
jgi:hypothetical protein